MDTSKSKNPEKVSEQSLDKGPEKRQESKEIKEKAGAFKEGLSEVVDMSEVAEVSDDEVSEQTGEDKKRGPQGKIKTGKAAAVKKIFTIPSVEVMQTQIATRVKKEIAVLTHEAEKLANAGKHDFSPFHLNEVLGKIRRLREILSALAYASAESIKNWWLEFVKGNTI